MHQYHIHPDEQTVPIDGRVEPPRVLMSHAAWQRMMTYVRCCDQEINGFGLVHRLPGNVFLIDEVFITEQTVSLGHADADDSAMHRVMYELMQRGDDAFERLACQWHSHVNGEAYFSGTDHGTIEGFDQSEYWISIVTNHRGDIHCRLDVFSPVRLALEVEIEVVQPGLPADEFRALVAEVEQKVRAAPVTIWDERAFAIYGDLLDARGLRMWSMRPDTSGMDEEEIERAMNEWRPPSVHPPLLSEFARMGCGGPLPNIHTDDLILQEA